MPTPSEVYDGLRQQLLQIDPSEVGLSPTAQLARVWGLMMETGHFNAVSTLLCLAAGTTSLYLSSGGGIIGAGEHAQVADATRALLRVVESCLDRMPADV